MWPGFNSTKRKAPKQTEPWSKTKQQKIERKDKRLKRAEKRKLKQEAGTVKKKKKKSYSKEDMEELIRDVALMKKLRKKKVVVLFLLCEIILPSMYNVMFLFQITEEEFDAEFGNSGGLDI